MCFMHGFKRDHKLLFGYQHYTDLSLVKMVCMFIEEISTSIIFICWYYNLFEHLQFYPTLLQFYSIFLQIYSIVLQF